MKSLFLSLTLHNPDRLPLKNQLTRVRPILIVSFAAALAAIIGAVGLSLLTATPLSDLTRDPSSVTHSKFYIGLLSNLGIILWAAATTASFFGALLLNNYRRFHHSAIFLFSSGLLSLILMLDDLFLVHELILPRYFHIPETLVIAGYLLISLAYFVYFFPQILATDHLILIIALLFLGLSLTIDEIMSFSNLESFIEDSFKFSGILFWVAYYTRVSFTTVYDNLSKPAPEPAAISAAISWQPASQPMPSSPFASPNDLSDQISAAHRVTTDIEST